MSKKDIELRMAQLEKQFNDSMAIISSSFRELDTTIGSLARGLSSQDITLAAVRHLLVAAEILKDDDIESRISELVKVIQAKYDKDQAEMKKAMEEASEPKGLEGELKNIGKAAQNNQSNTHPDEAFIFGS